MASNGLAGSLGFPALAAIPYARMRSIGWADGSIQSLVRIRFPATRVELPPAHNGDRVTTLVKRALAGLAVAAGAAGVSFEGLWWQGNGLVEQNIARASYSSELLENEASQPLAFSTEPLFPEQAAPSRSSPGPRAVASDFWSFRPSRDAFRDNALLDLRKLNERTAGESGFVRLSPDKNSFERGDGQPIRFWAVTTGASINASPAELARVARFLAKRGVNLVRLLENVMSVDKNARFSDVNTKAIDRIWRIVAALKKEGIYTLISPYWPDVLKSVPASWNIDGLSKNQSPQGLLYFNPALQQAYRAWLKELFTRKNPYNGIPLGQDPAVAFIQLQNEDGLLWWSTQAIKGSQLELLGKQFGDWAAAKHGSVEAALRDWGGGAMKEDDPCAESWGCRSSGISPSRTRACSRSVSTISFNSSENRCADLTPRQLAIFAKSCTASF